MSGKNELKVENLKISFTNKDGKKVLEIDETKKNMIVLDESLKELAEEAKVQYKEDSEGVEDSD